MELQRPRNLIQYHHPIAQVLTQTQRDWKSCPYFKTERKGSKEEQKELKFAKLRFSLFTMTSKLLVLSCLILTATSTFGQSINHVKSYNGYSVVRVIPQTNMQLEYLRDLEQEMALESSPIEFWKLGCCVGTPSDVMVGPISSYWFMNQLTKLGMEPNVLIDDVASTIENQRVIGRANQDDFFSNYHPINEVWN